MIKELQHCPICQTPMSAPLIELPRLPLTGIFLNQAPTSEAPVYDQAFDICSKCGHGQLTHQIDPEKIYDGTYSFRTSDSHTAQSGTDQFLAFLDQVTHKDQKFETVLDVGCNDLHLLKKLDGRAKKRVGIDPIWRGKESENKDSTIEVHGALLGELDLRKVVGNQLDLVVCRHTLEHIQDPITFLQQLFEAGSNETLYVFEFPGLESLIRRYRYDQVFHQHLQYFSWGSFAELVSRCEGHILSASENPHHWGAFFFAFRRGMSSDKTLDFQREGQELRARVKKGYPLFRQTLHTCAQTLEDLAKKEAVYGYGGAQMLPVISYHMGTSLNELQALFDDDRERSGLYYPNFAFSIEQPSGTKQPTPDSSVLITAPDSVRPILKKVMTYQPRNILVPMVVQ